MKIIENNWLHLTKLLKGTNHDNLIYKYKTKERTLKDFKNYENLVDLFKNLRDCKINQKEY